MSDTPTAHLGSPHVVEEDACAELRAQVAHLTARVDEMEAERLPERMTATERRTIALEALVVEEHTPTINEHDDRLDEHGHRLDRHDSALTHVTMTSDSIDKNVRLLLADRGIKPYEPPASQRPTPRMR